MQVIPTELPDVKVIVPKRIKDARGFFSETYSRRALADAGIDVEFVQDNQSLSVERGVVRGLHYQLPPMAQHKLVRVVRGAILDVAVDIRRGSPTFGRHVAVRIGAEEWNQILVPIGFAHGFVTLEPNTEVIYKVSNSYSPAHDRGLRWDDPGLNINWGIDPRAAILSERDRKHPTLRDASELF
jgi:dTDP-4-dehydrorhamnose 3,5-epimerase